MKCPECGGEFDGSTVVRDMSVTAQFWDDECRLHCHDEAHYVWRAVCEKGHVIEVETPLFPCWCGWPKEAQDDRA